MRKSYLSLLAVLLISFISYSQEDLPTDYLTKEFHASRRDSLRGRMPANSVTVIFASPVRNFANDVDYTYHQNPDLYYFSGYKEPNAVLFIFKDAQTDAQGKSYSDLFFIQERNPQAEQWTGKRLGVEGVKEKLGISNSYNGKDFASYNIDFNKFDKIIFDELYPDAGDSRFDPANLSSLTKQFRQKAAVPDSLGKAPKFNNRLLYRQITGALREIKTAEEMVLLRKAIEISCIGQNEVMKTVRADMSETEIQGLHEYVHKKYGAEYVGYPSIVGAGANGCVLHYIENSKTRVGNNMVLMDVGAEYHGYTADVTRTIPVNGKFSPEQKIIYNIVYQAQEEAFKLCKEGTPWQDVNKKAREIVANGLIKLGIIKEAKESQKYYPHGLGHHIGLDVHDRAASSVLKKGMVMTIEPGIYIPPGSDCDKKWWGIAVRIEDDILIKEKDYELLTIFAPRKAEDVEKMVNEKSVLDNYVLPKLSSGKKAF